MIKKSNITEQVIEYFKKNIENGEWKLGDKIPSENELTGILGVSRASIRAAIQQFIAIGMMETFHGVGTFIKSDRLDVFNSSLVRTKHYDYYDLEKVLEFRLIVEVESAGLAAKNITEANLQKLRGYLENMKNSVGKSEEFVKNDMAFHAEIAKATGNHIIENSLSDFFTQKEQNHKDMNELFGYEDGIYYHSLILDAFENRDIELVKKLMSEHIQKSIDDLKE